MLTRDEKMLIADCLNGCGMSLTADPEWIGLMIGNEGAVADAEIGMDAMDRITITGHVCSGLEHEVYDSIRLDQTDKKWGVDGRALLNKIAAMTPDQRETLIRKVAEVWERNDESFESDLVACEV